VHVIILTPPPSFFSAPSGPPSNIMVQVWSKHIILYWDPPEPQVQNEMIINYFIIIE